MKCVYYKKELFFNKICYLRLCTVCVCVTNFFMTWQNIRNPPTIALKLLLPGGGQTVALYSSLSVAPSLTPTSKP